MLAKVAHDSSNMEHRVAGEIGDAGERMAPGAAGEVMKVYGPETECKMPQATHLRCVEL